jgi:hypothetical protein
MLEKISKIKETYGNSPARPAVAIQFQVEYGLPTTSSVKDNGTLSGWP